MPAAEAASRRVCATRAASTCPPRHSPPRNVPKHIWPHAQPPRIAAELPTAPEAAVGAQRRCGTAAVQRRSRQPGWRPRRLPGANVPVPRTGARPQPTSLCHDTLLPQLASPRHVEVLARRTGRGARVRAALSGSCCERGSPGLLACAGLLCAGPCLRDACSWLWAAAGVQPSLLCKVSNAFRYAAVWIPPLFACVRVSL